MASGSLRGVEAVSILTHHGDEEEVKVGVDAVAIDRKAPVRHMGAVILQSPDQRVIVQPQSRGTMGLLMYDVFDQPSTYNRSR